jgi:glutamate dehydrogenase/leucine dehydrogenase
MHTRYQGQQILHYRDPVEGFQGFLAFSGNEHRLAAGGCRVVPGLDATTIMALADAMTLKQRLLGLAVDGAKAGIDYDPRAPGKHQALSRFIRFLRPHLLERLSMGPDRGTSWAELEGIAQAEGILSVKSAIARAQEFDTREFTQRLAILGADVNGMTVGQRRAGHALAYAALASCEEGSRGYRPLRVAIQGFGNLGRGAALSLAEAGVVVTAIADESGCISDYDGLDVNSLLATPLGTSLIETSAATKSPREFVTMAEADILVLAACEKALTAEQAHTLRARAVVVGANLGLAESLEALFHTRGITVVPDFVAGCGGSASMDALFGPLRCPSAAGVLNGTAVRMHALVRHIIDRSQSEGHTPRAAALTISSSQRTVPGLKPYGQSRNPQLTKAMNLYSDCQEPSDRLRTAVHQ